VFFVEGIERVIYLYFSRQILKTNTAHLTARKHPDNMIDLRLVLIYLPSLGSLVSIPVTVIGIFQYLNPSDGTVTPWSTQPLTEMSTRNISRAKRRPVHRADNRAIFMCQLFRICRSLNLLDRNVRT